MAVKETNTIEKTVKSDLCCGCGTCVSMCPTQAITLGKDGKRGTYIPKLEHKKCNQCEICFEVCPGHSVEYQQLNLAIFTKHPENILIGNYVNCYIGHATDHEIRYNSASGGLVTALLIFALEERIIAGALVTKMNDNNPLEPEVFIARNKEEIISASKSKYCPVAANIGLKEILREDGKFAIVGLPCHIIGIRKAEMINKKLKERIALHLGIFCGHGVSFLGTEFLLQQMNIKKEEVKIIDYRGDGWPGKILIELKNNSRKFIPYLEYWDRGFGLYFIPIRCMLCNDGACELADISLGDAWNLPEVSQDKIGSSLIISRTEIGEKIVHDAVLHGKIELNKINSNRVIQSQGRMLRRKKRDSHANIFVFKLLGKKAPLYNAKLLKPKPIAYLNAISLYLQLSISPKPYLWGLLRTYISLKPYTIGVLLRFGSSCLDRVRRILRSNSQA